MSYKQHMVVSCLLYLLTVPTSIVPKQPKTELSLPNKECYWVLPDRLLAGQYPGSYNEISTRKKLCRYLDTGISFFLDLTEQNEISPTGERKPYDKILQAEAHARNIKVQHQRMSIQDFGIPTRAFMTRILDTIDDALKAGHKVYVHCWGGIGRTGTVVGCYFVRHGKSGEQALKHIARLWRSVGKSKTYPLSPEIEVQRKFVAEFTDTLKSESNFCFLEQERISNFQSPQENKE